MHEKSQAVAPQLMVIRPENLKSIFQQVSLMLKQNSKVDIAGRFVIDMVDTAHLTEQ